MRMMRSLFTIKVKNNDVRTPECTDIYVNVKELSRLNGLFGGPRKEEEEEEKKERKKEKKSAAVSRPNIGMRPRITGSLKNPSYLHKIPGNVSSSSTRPVSSASSSLSSPLHASFR